MNYINNIKQKKRITCAFEFILVYLYLLFSSGFGFQNNNGTLALLFLILVPICFLLLYKRIIINPTYITISFFITLIVIISHMLAQDSLKLSLITVLGYISAIMFVLSLRFEDYQEIYLRVLKILVPFSIFCYVVSVLAPTIITRFPIVVSKYTGSYVYNLVFCFIKSPGSLFNIRNQSIFWEPGAYVTYLTLAFAFEIRKEKPSQFFILSIIIALFTTFSTMGYIILILITYIWFKISRLRNKRLNKKMTMILISVVIVGAFIAFQKMPDYVIRTIYVKLEGFFAGSSTNESAQSRIDSIIYPLQVFVNKPLFGSGKTGFNYWVETIGHQNLTFTPINWFAKHGIIVGLFMIWGLWNAFKNTLNSCKIVNLLIFISTLLMISAEEYSENPSILILVFYGIFYETRSKNKQWRDEKHEDS